MINNLNAIFQSAIKSLEILYILENTKPVARILVKEDELKNSIDFINKNYLEFSISNFKLKKINNKDSLYSDKSLKISKDSLEKGHFALYISKIKELAEKAKAYEENNMHLKLGLLLGYPKCCCEFFVKNFSENDVDLTLNILDNSEGFEFPSYTNIAARHFDVSLLNYFPCNFKCRFSINLAKENFEIIKKYSEPLFEDYKNTLKSAVLYTKGNGIFLLKNYKKINDKIFFKDILYTIKNNLYSELINNKKLKIIAKDKIEINNEELNNLGFMLFS